MIIGVLAYCFSYSILLVVGCIGIRKYFRKKKLLQKENDRISLDDITLIIPFRNEEKRISPLLKSIKNSKELPSRIIFVDDYSTDKTVEIIHSILKHISVHFIQSEKQGKKHAINTGIKEAETPYILTMDADTWFEVNYFSQLKLLAPIDMHILPVKMASKGCKILFELDVYMLNGLNLIVTGLKRPIAASGANLLFRKTAYEVTNSLHSHSYLLSGDDQFLLADFNNNQQIVTLQTDSKLAVTTFVPDSLIELFSQRLRWILKTPKVKDSFAVKIGVIQLSATILFFALSFWLLKESQLILFFILFIIKSTMDILAVKPYFYEIKKQGLLLLVPVYEIILPVYTIMLSITALFYKPSWKGRK